MFFIILILPLFADLNEAITCNNAYLSSCFDFSEPICFTQDVAIINTDTAPIALKVSTNNDTTFFTLSQDGLYVLKRFLNLTLVSDTKNTCIKLKPLDQYSKILGFETMTHTIIEDSIWRVRISKLDEEEVCNLKIQTDDKILSAIDIFGSFHKEHHKFMSSTVFPLGTVSNEILIEIHNVIDQTKLEKNKSYNLTLLCERSTRNGTQNFGFVFLILIIPLSLPLIFVSIFHPLPCPTSEERRFENYSNNIKNNLLPLGVFGITFFAVMVYAMISVHFVENGFEIDECRQNFKCFDKTVYIFRDMPLPVNKIWSSSYFISIGLGIILAANFRISTRIRNLLIGPPIIIKWNCYFSAFGGILILQGIGSIMYHQCPNNITKGIDVIPMQAIVLLATQYILVKILETCKIHTNPTHPSVDDFGTMTCFCKKIEKIIFLITIPIQLFMIGLTIVLQIFTSRQNVTIPVAIVSILYFMSVISTSVYVCKMRGEKKQKIFKSTIGILLTVIALLTLIGAFICFSIESTTTNGEPWESREKNRKCWIGIFDQHELWHFLIATSVACQIYRIWSFGQQNKDANHLQIQNQSDVNEQQSSLL